MDIQKLSQLQLVDQHRSKCGYCHADGRTSVSYGTWAYQLTCEDYQDLMDCGWRRSGHYIYKPVFNETCCPSNAIRLDVDQFRLSKSQKICFNKFEHVMQQQTASDPSSTLPKSSTNTERSLADRCRALFESHSPESSPWMTITLIPSRFTEESYALYRKYQMAIHHDDEDDLTPDRYRRFLVDSPLIATPSLGSFHQEYRILGQLVAVGVLDFLPHSLSSVYFFHDPAYNPQLSFGVLSALQEIHTVQSLRDPARHHYYLGYYIHACPKMRYKAQFRPSQLLDSQCGQWVDLPSAVARLNSDPRARLCVPCNHSEKERAISNLRGVHVRIDCWTGTVGDLETLQGVPLEALQRPLRAFQAQTSASLTNRILFVLG